MRVLVYGMVGTNQRGIENYLLKMNQHMSKDIVFDYVIEGTKCIHEEAITSRGGKVYYIAPRHSSPLKNIRDNRRLLKSLREEIDAVYFNLSSLSWIAPVRIAINYGYPVYVHAHNAQFISNNSGIIYRVVNYINKRRLNSFNITRLTCSKLATDFLFMNPDNVTMIYNAIPTDSFAFCETKRQEKRRELGINNEFVVGFVGSLSYQKNPLYLPLILKSLLDAGQNVKMIVVGEGDMREALNKELIEYGVAERCSLLGKRNDVNGLMQAMDVLVLPSHHEGLPYVVVEAQTTGLTCLVSDAVTREVNATGNVEFLALTENAHNWRDAVMHCITNTDLNRSKWADYMRETSFNIDVEAKKLESILRGL